MDTNTKKKYINGVCFTCLYNMWYFTVISFGRGRYFWQPQAKCRWNKIKVNLLLTAVIFTCFMVNCVICTFVIILNRDLCNIEEWQLVKLRLF